MNSTNNENNFEQPTLSNGYSCSFDKNEFYTENGLPFDKKRDSNSHSKKTLDKKENREAKTKAKIINSLPVVFPLTYDGLMQWHENDRNSAAEPTQQPETISGKVKNTSVTKLFHNRKLSDPTNATQKMMCGDYEDQILGEEDALKAAWEWEMELEDDREHHAEMMDKEREDNEEARYQEYLVAKYMWDFPDDDMSQFELTWLKDRIEAYEAEMPAKLAEKKEKKTMTLEEYEDQKMRSQSLSLWERFGLTAEQYDVNREYENNCAALSAFYSEPDYANYPDYGIRLEAAVKKYEDEFNAALLQEAEDDDNNDWWIPYGLKQKDDKDEDDCEDDREVVTYEDWCDDNREEYLETCKQNALDDAYDRDDY
jgi:hypothetical protein